MPREVFDPLRAAPAVVGGVIGEEGVVHVTALVERIPRVDARPEEVRVVVVAEVIVTIARPDEEAREQRRGQQDDARAEIGTGRVGKRLRERDGGEQDAAIQERSVPVAVDEQVADRAPDVMGGDPEPVRMARRPEAGPPGVARSRQNHEPGTQKKPGPGAGRVGPASWLAGGGGRYRSWRWSADAQNPETHWQPPTTGFQ